MMREQRKAVLWGLLTAGLLGAAIFVGSRNLRHIDAALVGYTFACLFAAFGLGYRYFMWLQRPPTRRYWYRGWQSFLRKGRFLGSVRDFVTRFARFALVCRPSAEDFGLRAHVEMTDARNHGTRQGNWLRGAGQSGRSRAAGHAGGRC